MDNPLPFVQCIGACTVDTVLAVDRPAAGDAKILASDGAQFGAGMATSAACAIVALGGRAGIWGRIGDDPPGDFYLASVAAAGVDTSGIRRFPGRKTAVSAIVVEPSGRRLIVPYYDPEMPSAPDWLPLDSLDRAAAVLGDPRWPEGTAALLRAARARAIPGVLDADTATPEILRSLTPLASHVVFSEPGLTIESGIDDTEEALIDATARLPGFVGVTLGARGFAWLADGNFQHVPAPVVDVVDTLSAGDVFHGAFALGLAEGRDIRDVAGFACAAAAIKVSRFGGRLGAPSRAETEESLRTLKWSGTSIA